jgi:copper homeostasis protein
MLEIACFNPESALKAHAAGAQRIELCVGASVGGTTPTLATLQTVLAAKVDTPVNVMIRPLGGCFVFSSGELEQMKIDIQMFKPLVNGFVFGVLDVNNRIDIETNRELVSLAAPRPCTYHRAIDEVDDLLQAVDDAVQCGFAAILTSGGEPDAVSGMLKIAAMVRHANGRVAIIAGGGVRSSNIDTLKQVADANWYHSSALIDDSGVASFDEIRKLGEVLHAGHVRQE